MAGLLDFLDTDQGRLGLGLLAAAGPRADGAGFGQRLMEGVGSMDQWKQQVTQNKMRDMQMQQAQMQMADAQRRADQERTLREMAGKFVVAGKSALPPLMGDKESGILPSAGSAAAPATYDYAGYAAALASAGMPDKALEIQAKIQKDDTPQVLAPGATLLSGRASGYKPLYTAASKDESTDPKIKQYEYAQKNGYKGSFDQFVTLGPALMAGAMAPLRAAQVQDITEENAYKLPPQRPTPKSNAPMLGQVVQGYKFKGGNPADQKNWEKQ